jgi:hypothetical protein
MRLPSQSPRELLRDTKSILCQRKHNSIHLSTWCIYIHLIPLCVCRRQMDLFQKKNNSTEENMFRLRSRGTVMCWFFFCPCHPINILISHICNKAVQADITDVPKQVRMEIFVCGFRKRVSNFRVLPVIHKTSNLGSLACISMQCSSESM